MLPCLGHARFWPLTSAVALLRAPLTRTAGRVLARSIAGASEQRQYATLAEALEIGAPFPQRGHRCTLAIGTRGDTWTVVLDAASPHADVLYYYLARAELNLRCEYVGLSWVPGSQIQPGGSAFAHYLPQRRSLLRGRPPVIETARTLQAADSDDGYWTFDAVGPPRDYEDPSAYEARRKADRLPLALLRRYAAATGVPVEDPDWLTGPVVMRRDLRVDREPAWHTLAERREQCGYPAEGMPERL